MLIDIANETQALLLLDLSSTTAAATSGSIILFFWADWHVPSSPGGAFHVAIQTLADSSSSSSSNNNVTFYRVLAEGAPNLSRKVRLFLVYIFLYVDLCVYFCFISILLIILFPLHDFFFHSTTCTQCLHSYSLTVREI